ncbi:MAG: polysaccharide pyruvyl transferase family protein [Bacillaceae bacterium]|nr:polysaccharide pyruvyl transferase family protein [Bacillaceae bacterium]
MIHGFYGASNAGDDAILHSIIRSIRKINSESEIIVTVWSMKIPAYYGLDNVNCIMGSDIKAVSDSLKSCSLLIVGGGGLLQDYNGYQPAKLFINQKDAINYYSFPIILAKLLDIKTMLYAVGVGPIYHEESKKALKWITDIVDKITVRDVKSYNLLKGLGIKKHILSSDPAINLPVKPYAFEEDRIPANKGEINIGLNIRNWSYSENALINFETEFIKILDKLASNYKINFYVFPFNNLPSEVKKAKELIEKINGNTRIVKYDISPEEYKYLCTKLDLMIAMRLHASIFSIFEKIPSIGISYDEKVSILYTELGLEDYCYNLESIDFNQLEETISKCISDPNKQRFIIENKLSILLEREKNNEVTLRKLIEGE